MTTYFVSPSGNDTTGTGTQGAPWKTFNKALPNLVAGDTLFARGGTYTDRATAWPAGGTGWGAGQFITIAGYQAESVLIRAAGTLSTQSMWDVVRRPTPTKYLLIEKFTFDATLAYGCLTMGTNDGTMDPGAQNCKVQNCEFYQTAGPPIPKGDIGCPVWWLGENCELANCICRDSYWGYGLYVKGKSAWIHHNLVYGNDRYGIHNYRNNYPDLPNQDHIIECNKIYNNGFSVHHEDAIRAGILVGHCQNTIVRNNWIYGNARGMVLYGNATGVKVYHNTFYSNGDGIVINTGHTGGETRNNILWQSGSITGNLAGNTVTSNLLNVNPQFVNAGASDLHITQGSPARNAGAVLVSVLTDIDGDTRPNGVGYDQGADEFQEAIPSTVHYVSPTGSNGAAGTEAAPWQTINYALSQMSAGHTLVLRAGTYAVDIDTTVQTIPAGTSWEAATILKAYAGETVTIRRVNIATAGVQYVIFLDLHFDRQALGASVVNISAGANHIRFERCEMTGGTGNGVILAAHASGGFNEVLNCDVHHNGTLTTDDGIEIWCTANLVQQSLSHHNAGPGITFAGASATDNTIRNNRIYNNNTTAGGSGGLMMTAGGTGLIYNNVVYANTSGIHLSGAGHAVQNNTVYGNTNYGVRLLGGASGAVVENNILFGQTTNYENNGTGTVANNQTTSDPLVVNAGAGDFHLTASSPAVNAGKTIAATAVDADGWPRPQGAAFDTGAYEFHDFVEPVDLSPLPAVVLARVLVPTVTILAVGGGAWAGAGLWRRRRR